MCEENQACQEDYFDKLITQDETWVHHYMIQRIKPIETMEVLWLTTSEEVQRSVGKVMLMVFWDQHAVVTVMDLLAKGTITDIHYDALLQKAIMVHACMQVDHRRLPPPPARQRPGSQFGWSWIP